MEGGGGVCELDPCAQPVLPAPVKEDGHSRQNLAPPECDRQGVWLSGGAQRQGNLRPRIGRDFEGKSLLYLELQVSQRGHLSLSTFLSWVSSLILVSACPTPSPLRLRRGSSRLRALPAELGLGLAGGPGKNMFCMYVRVRGSD